MLSSELVTIAKAGGHISINNGKKYLSSELVTIAKALIPGATLTINNADTFLSSELVTIAKAKPGQVVFGFEK